MSKIRGLFDEQIRLEKLSKKQDPLEQLAHHIDFEFFRKPLGINSCIHEKGYRGKPLTKRQQQSNRKKSKTRARVEHIFAFMTNSMNEMYLCCRSFKRNAASIGLMNRTYNLFRLVQLKVELRS
ncbi:MAG: transposase [Bacteroidetes bacterium]|nr:transposase [Bacteroidota bacterium]